MKRSSMTTGFASNDGNRTPSAATRRWILASLLASPLAVGCGGSGLKMASMNPFSRADSIASPAAEPASIAAGENSSQSSNQLVSFGKNAVGKTTGAVGAIFKRKGSEEVIPEDDPLSLSSKPETVDPKVYVANGQLWESTGDIEKATESYNRALKLDPEHAGALANLARLNYRQSNYPVAAELFQKALAGSPNDPQLYNELGLTLHKLGRTDMAVTVMQRALAIAPGTSRFANNLASVMHESGDPTGAYEVLVKNNKPAVAHFNMAYLQYKSGNVSDAQMHLAETLKFESVAGSDAAVARAVTRSKDMIAQINSLSPMPSASPGGGNPPLPNVLPPVGGGSTGPAIATAIPSGTVATAQSSVQPAASAQHPIANAAGAIQPGLPLGYGWPSANPAANAMAAQTSNPVGGSDPSGVAASVPAWATAKPQSNVAAQKPLRVATLPSPNSGKAPTTSQAGFPQSGSPQSAVGKQNAKSAGFALPETLLK